MALLAAPVGRLLLTGLAVLVPPLAVADLGAALRKAGGIAPAPLPTDAPLSGPVVVPLERGPGGLYYGRVSVGHPMQALRVLFDTSSGHVILPHRACRSTACSEHSRYSPWESSTALDINLDGSLVHDGERLAKGTGSRQGLVVSYAQSDLGEGNASGVVVRDSLCLDAVAGGPACVDLGILAATALDDVPFRAMPNDGIVGLGLESLAAGHICSFFARLLEGSTGVVPQFGIVLRAGRGEVHFGGHEKARLAEPLRWFPVDHPESGYWQVAIRAVRVGNVTVDDCEQGCHGIVDSGVSRLGVQASGLPKLKGALVASLGEEPGCSGAELQLDLGEMVLALRPEDYTDEHCAPQLGALPLEEPEFVGVYALGASVLRRYYAAFDWERRMLAFAPLAAEPPREEAMIVL